MMPPDPAAGGPVIADPASRIRMVRDEIAAQRAKLPATDRDGLRRGFTVDNPTVWGNPAQHALAEAHARGEIGHTATAADIIKAEREVAAAAQPPPAEPPSAGTGAAAAASRVPRPDPTQGARGAGSGADAELADAQQRGDWRTVIALLNQKTNRPRPGVPGVR